jgi:hypothetical protein
MIHPHDSNIVAIASDAKVDTQLSQLDLNAPEAIAAFILKQVGLGQGA